jgi:ankyrin repeat protein
MVAINENLPDMLALLLQRGANPGAPDRDGLTPLYWTTFYQRDDMTRLLLAAGAHPEVKKVRIPAAMNYSLGAF